MARKPDYRLTLTAKDKENRSRTDAGVAWRTEGGGISISLNPGVVLDHALTKEFYITLWEASYASSGVSQQSTHSQGLRPPPTRQSSTGAKTYPIDVDERLEDFGPTWGDDEPDIPF